MKEINPFNQNLIKPYSEIRPKEEAPFPLPSTPLIENGQKPPSNVTKLDTSPYTKTCLSKLTLSNEIASEFQELIKHPIVQENKRVLTLINDLTDLNITSPQENHFIYINFFLNFYITNHKALHSEKRFMDNERKNAIFLHSLENSLSKENHSIITKKSFINFISNVIPDFYLYSKNFDCYEDLIKYSGSIWKCIDKESVEGVEEGFCYVYVLDNKIRSLPWYDFQILAIGKANSENGAVIEEYPSALCDFFDENSFLKQLGFDYDNILCVQRIFLPNAQVLLNRWEQLPWKYEKERPQLNILEAEGVIDDLNFSENTLYYHFILSKEEFVHDQTLHLMKKLSLIYNHFNEFEKFNNKISSEKEVLIKNIKLEENKELNIDEQIKLTIVKNLLGRDSDNIYALHKIEALEKASQSTLKERLIRFLDNSLEYDIFDYLSLIKEKFGKVEVERILNDKKCIEDYIDFLLKEKGS